MSCSLLNRLALLLLVIAMTSNSLWGSSGAGLAHDIDHLFKANVAALDYEHAGLPAEVSGGETSDDFLNPLVHHLLHGADHSQLFPHALVRAVFALSVRVLVLPGLVELYLPLQPLSPPFRPPRSDVFAA